MSLSKKYIYLGNIFFKYRTFIPLFFLLPLFVFVAYYPMLFFKNDIKWFVFCLFISFSGQFIRFLTLGYTPTGTSGRNTNKQVAKTLNTTGVYSLVRHPLYLGNYLIWIGLISFFYNTYPIFIFTVFFYYYYQKIMYAEEAFLINKFQDSYYKWSKNVPSFIPKITGYRKTTFHFSLRKVLIREYSNISGFIIAYIMIYNYSIFINGWDNYAFINSKLILGIILVFFFTMRFIKKGKI